MATAYPLSMSPPFKYYRFVHLNIDSRDTVCKYCNGFVIISMAVHYISRDTYLSARVGLKVTKPVWLVSVFFPSSLNIDNFKSRTVRD